MANSAQKTSESNEEKPAKQGLARIDLHRPLESLRRQVDRLLEDFHLSNLHLPLARNGFEAEPHWRRELLSSTLPVVDIAEEEKSFELTAELPGMDEQNIKIKLSNGSLIISGEKKAESKQKNNNYCLSERHYGAFERVFDLPKGVDPERIEARINKGLLSISLPKKPEASKAEKILQIRAG
jgi:HSP20 family protein